MSDVAPRSLVIDSRNLERLCMDGPALKVSMRASSPLLFPVRRLGRVHIIGTPEQGIDSLLQCAEQGVPVAFFRPNGRLRCLPQTPVVERALVDHWFEHVEFDPEVQQLYQEWQNCQGLHVLAQLGFNRGDGAVRRQLVHEALHGVCRKRLGKEAFAIAQEWLDGLLSFHLLQVIEQAGFSQPRGKQKLLGDIKPLCELWLLYAFVGHLQQVPGFRVTPRYMTGFYQEQANLLEALARRMLIQLVARLEAVV